MAVETLGVVGAGQMGSGVAQVAAQAGIPVRLVDAYEPGLERGISRIEDGLARLVKKEKLTEAAAREVRALVTPSTRVEDLEGSSFVVEAIVENEDEKKKLFSRLDQLLAPEVILASNTSSISITRLSAVTGRPQRFIGMHFMNPVPVMKLVEVIRGIATDDDTYQATLGLAEKLGKTCVTSRDYPGFIINRILLPMINEAFYALMEGVAKPEDIDTGMKLGTNQPMGPLELADFIGLDTCLAIMEVLHTGLGDAKYRPCPLLRQYVDAGWHGRKSGRGVYTY
jgi:3-hydroxybutyryl-CoA dehydrogenase